MWDSASPGLRATGARSPGLRPEGDSGSALPRRPAAAGRQGMVGRRAVRPKGGLQCFQGRAEAWFVPALNSEPRRGLTRFPRNKSNVLVLRGSGHRLCALGCVLWGGLCAMSAESPELPAQSPQLAALSPEPSARSPQPKARSFSSLSVAMTAVSTHPRNRTIATAVASPPHIRRAGASMMLPVVRTISAAWSSISGR